MIVLDPKDKRPIYQQITEKIKNLIALSVLKTDEKMPSVRQLAIDMSINPNTIQKAYSELERDGYIYVIKGKGNFVSDITEIIPVRQNQFYTRLDELLDTDAEYGLSKENVVNHINTYYETRRK